MLRIHSETQRVHHSVQVPKTFPAITGNASIKKIQAFIQTAYKTVFDRQYRTGSNKLNTFGDALG
jgi:hypothetical protein